MALTRGRRGLLVAVAFLAGVAAGPDAGLISRQLGSALGIGAASAQDAGRLTGHRPLRLFRDILELIRADYVDQVRNNDLIENAINGMLIGLDPHSSYMRPEDVGDLADEMQGEYGGLGLEAVPEAGYFRVISSVEGSAAARAGVRVGDLIIALDGKPARGLSVNNFVHRTRGPPNSKITLSIRREGVDRLLEIALIREIINVQAVRHRLEAGDVGYIRLTLFVEQADAGLKRAVQILREQAGNHLRAIVLDLRDNPGGLLDEAVAVASDFLDQGRIVSTRARHPKDNQIWYAKGGDITGGLPLVVLMNAGSASSSEIVAGALQDRRRAILLGTRSFGKGSLQTMIPLPGNRALLLTTARYYTPSGRSVQGLGITPDVLVAESQLRPPHFEPASEANLNRFLPIQGGSSPLALPPRLDLPPIARTIPYEPPEDFPAYDPSNPGTDFQLQQALVLAQAMADPKRGATH